MHTLLNAFKLFFIHPVDLRMRTNDVVHAGVGTFLRQVLPARGMVAQDVAQVNKNTRFVERDPGLHLQTDNATSVAVIIIIATYVVSVHHHYALFRDISWKLA